MYIKMIQLNADWLDSQSSKMLKNSFSHVKLVQLVFITLVYILFNRIQDTLIAKHVRLPV